MATDTPPPYYSKLTVLDPDQTDAVVSDLVALADRFDGVVGLKDSFCRLDLAQDGFEMLFEADWIWRHAVAADMPTGWQIVKSSDDLLLWENSWRDGGSPMGHGMFPATLPTREDVFFLGRKTNGRFDAGCIVNMSADCAGVSNLFTDSASQLDFSQAADAASAIANDLPVVGYVSSEEVTMARHAGFDLVGPLRILVSRNAFSHGREAGNLPD